MVASAAYTMVGYVFDQAQGRRPLPAAFQVAPIVAVCWVCAESEEGGYELDLEFIKAMMEEFREQRLVHKRFAFQIVLEVGTPS